MLPGKARQWQQAFAPTPRQQVLSAIIYTQFAYPHQEKMNALNAYLRSLKPIPNPYPRDGGLATIEEILTKYNKDDTHGRISYLTAQQIADLAEYVLTR